MRGIREILGLSHPMPGLEEILDNVAEGHVTTTDAAARIRELASQPHIPSWAPRIFCVFGVIFALIGVGFGCYSVGFGIGTAQAQGIVTKVIRGSPVVEYQVNGKPFSYRSPISSAPPAYVVGEIVEILYRPDNPASAMINTFTDRWLFPLAFGVGGSLFVVLGRFFPQLLTLMTGKQVLKHRSDCKHFAKKAAQSGVWSESFGAI
ncbi:MAG: hypothetical protein JWM11_244 [Planctomycetaceae bacterium]|nr:hypothetical protein [Planctomycetaceae bacterium]